MEYRRFGKTEKDVSVITLGGMRLKHGWDEPRDVIPDEMVEQGSAVVKSALDLGINLIETAYNYVKSEHAFGIILNDVLKVKRDSYHLMTKGDATTALDMRRMVEEQLKALKTDYFDFYAYHGINDENWLKTATSKNGAVEELHKMKEEGIIKHIGFSTHANLDVIIDTIQTDMFEFMNLHYYYFFQRNKGAIDLAESKNMGVFIISPNDKGGKLYSPPQKLEALTAPLTPSQFNARYCLSNPAIHTLTFGFPVTSVAEQVNGIFPTAIPLSSADARIKHNLDVQNLLDPFAEFDGYCMENDPSGINIPEILRFRRMWKCFDMKEFGEYRYNMLKEGDRWTPGALPTKDRMALMDMSRCPDNVPVKKLILETHEALHKTKEPNYKSLVLDPSIKNNLLVNK